MFAIGADHGGFNLKEEIKKEFNGKIDFKDFGTISTEAVNYPDIAFKVAESVSNGECEGGILICKSGIGMCIAANKVKNIRCAKISNEREARLSKEHNDVNIISLAAEEITINEAKKLILVWLESTFQGGRHKVRVDLIKDYENRN